MTLSDLLTQHTLQAKQSVPDWMLGCFRRRCISFANGESDNTTLVYWLQSRNFTIDLRLPPTAKQVPAIALADYNQEQLQARANYEGWIAQSHWHGTQLRWSGGSSLQLHNRWPEPALLQRIGNCMVEFAPSGAYVEDWRLQPTTPGPLIGLRLLSETTASGNECAREGGLIICGDWAGLVIGRKQPLAGNGLTLPERVAAAQGKPEELERLLGFEASIAKRSHASSYVVQQSTLPDRRGKALFATDDFTWLGDNKIRQTLTEPAETVARTYTIDTFEKHLQFALQTPASEQAQAWYERESTTLARYGQLLD